MPPATPKDTKTVVGASGNLVEGSSEFRTGMAKGSRAYRASNAVLVDVAEGKDERSSALLGHSELPSGDTA